MVDEEKFTKVRVDLPNHWGAGGESMWARRIGDDLYELRNVPFFAYGLNFLDVVRATVDAPDLKPEIRAVVRKSGHRTLRVMFSDSLPEGRAVELLDSLSPLKVSWEGANSRHFALDLEPDADEGAVRGRLDAWEAGGLLHYETCEALRPGTFDRGPESTELE